MAPLTARQQALEQAKTQKAQQEEETKARQAAQHEEKVKARQNAQQEKRAKAGHMSEKERKVEARQQAAIATKTTRRRMKNAMRATNNPGQTAVETQNADRVEQARKKAVQATARDERARVRAMRTAARSNHKPRSGEANVVGQRQVPSFRAAIAPIQAISTSDAPPGNSRPSPTVSAHPTSGTPNAPVPSSGSPTHVRGRISNTISKPEFCSIPNRAPSPKRLPQPPLPDQNQPATSTLNQTQSDLSVTSSQSSSAAPPIVAQTWSEVFPHGFRILNTSADGNECGLYALAISLEEQLPDRPIVSVDELRLLMLHERLRIGQNEDSYLWAVSRAAPPYTPLHVDMALMAWCRLYDRPLLRLGVIYPPDGGYPDDVQEYGMGTHNPEAPRIWIRHNGVNLNGQEGRAQWGHYEGLTATAPDSSTGYIAGRRRVRALGPAGHFMEAVEPDLRRKLAGEGRPASNVAQAAAEYNRLFATHERLQKVSQPLDEAYQELRDKYTWASSILNSPRRTRGPFRRQEDQEMYNVSQLRVVVENYETTIDDFETKVQLARVESAGALMELFHAFIAVKRAQLATSEAAVHSGPFSLAQLQGGSRSQRQAPELAPTPAQMQRPVVTESRLNTPTDQGKSSMTQHSKAGLIETPPGLAREVQERGLDCYGHRAEPARPTAPWQPPTQVKESQLDSGASRLAQQERRAMNMERFRAEIGEIQGGEARITAPAPERYQRSSLTPRDESAPQTLMLPRVSRVIDTVSQETQTESTSLAGTGFGAAFARLSTSFLSRSQVRPSPQPPSSLRGDKRDSTDGDDEDEPSAKRQKR